MSDIVARLYHHEVHAVHDFDDDCADAAKEIVRLRGWLKKIAEEDSFGGDHSVALAKAALEDEDE